MITTKIELRKLDDGGQEVVASSPDGSTRQLAAGCATLDDVERAARLAYSMGRRDARAETAAVLRGLLGF